MTREEAQDWAAEARGRWGVPVRIFERSLSAGGLDMRVFVVVIWPKGSKRVLSGRAVPGLRG